MAYSILDEIDGLGPKKKKSLLRQFKSIRALKASSVEDLCIVNGISVKLAIKIKNVLNA